MSYIHPALAEHLRRRWERADAYRFAAPGTPEAKMPGYLHPWAEVARQEQVAADEARARAAAEQDEFEREVLALRADHDRVRRMLADVKFELAMRRIFRKYSPDQPRVPAGNPDGGQWTSGGGGGGDQDQSVSDAPNSSQRIRLAQLTSPGATTTDAGPQFSPDKPGWHNYLAGPNSVCGSQLQCPRAEMVDQLARFSLPGRDPSRPIENGGTYPVHIPGTDHYVGDVQTRIAADGLTIVNRTMEGHIFFDGAVVRRLTQSDDGAWYVTTHGFGNNVQPGSNIVNELVGPETFNELDRQMRANIERHHAKGILDLAGHGVDGGGHPRSGHAVLGGRHEIA